MHVALLGFRCCACCVFRVLKLRVFRFRASDVAHVALLGF